MTGTIAALLMHTVLLAPGAKPYSEALKDSQDNGKPLLVLVSAEWCPACQVMKNTVLKPLEEEGQLESVEWATVNLDNDGPMARRLMRGGSIPQLILFQKTPAGWRRTQYVGAQTRSKIKELVSKVGNKNVLTATVPDEVGTVQK
ncbi:MAG: thioredoxin family protein [bacterium]|nr:thioredoxin family protein [bacterium]